MQARLERKLGRYMGVFGSGIFWVLIGLGLSVGAFVKPDWFMISFPWFRFPIGVLALLFGALQLVRHYAGMNHVRLTEDELARYGKRLSDVTPAILTHLESGSAVQDLMERFEKEKGLPQEVTYKYVAELKRYWVEQQKQDLLKDGSKTE